VAVFPGHQQGGNFAAGSVQRNHGALAFINQFSSRHSRSRRRAR
jgi:hypothetical protein